MSCAYSDRGRMSSATVGANTVNYLYNGLEQRVSKSGPAAVVPTGQQISVHDEASRLIGQYDANLVTVQETVYLVDTPVAVIKQTKTGSPATVTTTVHYAFAD